MPNSLTVKQAINNGINHLNYQIDTIRAKILKLQNALLTEQNNYENQKQVFLKNWNDTLHGSATFDNASKQNDFKNGTAQKIQNIQTQISRALVDEKQLVSDKTFLTDVKSKISEKGSYYSKIAEMKGENTSSLIQQLDKKITQLRNAKNNPIYHDPMKSSMFKKLTRMQTVLKVVSRIEGTTSSQLNLTPQPQGQMIGVRNSFKPQTQVPKTDKPNNFVIEFAKNVSNVEDGADGTKTIKLFKPEENRHLRFYDENGKLKGTVGDSQYPQAETIKNNNTSSKGNISQVQSTSSSSVSSANSKPSRGWSRFFFKSSILEPETSSGLNGSNVVKASWQNYGSRLGNTAYNFGTKFGGTAINTGGCAIRSFIPGANEFLDVKNASGGYRPLFQSMYNQGRIIVYEAEQLYLSMRPMINQTATNFYRSVQPHMKKASAVIATTITYASTAGTMIKVQAAAVIEGTTSFIAAYASPAALVTLSAVVGGYTGHKIDQAAENGNRFCQNLRRPLAAVVHFFVEPPKGQKWVYNYQKGKYVLSEKSKPVFVDETLLTKTEQRFLKEQRENKSGEFYIQNADPLSFLQRHHLSVDNSDQYFNKNGYELDVDVYLKRMKKKHLSHSSDSYSVYGLYEPIFKGPAFERYLDRYVIKLDQSIYNSIERQNKLLKESIKKKDNSFFSKPVLKDDSLILFNDIELNSFDQNEIYIPQKINNSSKLKFSTYIESADTPFSKMKIEQEISFYSDNQIPNLSYGHQSSYSNLQTIPNLNDIHSVMRENSFSVITSK